jgi:hypothetical protein
MSREQGAHYCSNDTINNQVLTTCVKGQNKFGSLERCQGARALCCRHGPAAADSLTSVARWRIIRTVDHTSMLLQCTRFARQLLGSSAAAPSSLYRSSSGSPRSPAGPPLLTDARSLPCRPQPLTRDPRARRQPHPEPPPILSYAAVSVTRVCSLKSSRLERKKVSRQV